MIQTISPNTNLDTNLKDAKSEDAAARPVYREFPASDYPTDVIQQLRANIDQLEDLQGRLGYVMGEVKAVAGRLRR